MPGGPGPLGGGPVAGGPGPLGGGPRPGDDAPGQKGDLGFGDLAAYLCRCSKNFCRGVVGSLTRGCPNTNRFLQCNNEVCTNQTCPTGQVWDRTKNACSACDAGFHVATNLQVCVCNQGTTFDPRTRACVACPTDSVQEGDRCYCNRSKVFDDKTNACRDCPTGSSLTRSQCQCNSTQFFNRHAWACQNCPGDWTPKPSSKRPFRLAPGAVCTCDATKGQIFDRDTVTCYTCPTGTTAKRDVCECSDSTQFFNMKTKACECREGFVANPSGAGCVRAPRGAQTTTTTAP